ncbi:HAD-IIA family hydrolase [Blastopirellula sp. JC732]|uniref:HAD-IIA family hydrolase n=1 Tax=Blastopirellula sediminis TaxID=2894196 RepID=A0A9X1MMK3_9BACT|nr:HAD-IIA family hydrolase [Blastopirellula sediminis]MCC9607692.1 HAD-IIA family hydrolase [Blastopirellula sediminis]MCC9629015.1 HAD-IIA family hydrolase [Blastopirellula sediminis]
MGLGFLIDMDGVIYRGSQLIDGADRFIATLKKKQIPFLFLTNNSQRTRRDVAAKLYRMGIDVEEERIFTCAMATARFLAKQKPGGTAFVIGEGGLHNALHRNGYAIVDHAPDYVVVGEARSITLEMLDAAVQMVLDGAQLIATNLDPNCPTKSGTRSGCGATVSFIEKATGKTAFSVGKPSPVMMRSAQWELGVRSWETVMIGDTMETDILGAVQMGYYATLTLSGGSRAEDLSSYAFRPDRVINSVADLIEDIENDTMLPAWDHGIMPHSMEENERLMYAASRGA